jgi:hypothetical protein
VRRQFPGAPCPPQQSHAGSRFNENSGYFGPRKFRGQFLAFGEEFANSRAAQGNMVLFAVRARLWRGHCGALFAVMHSVEKDWFDSQFSGLKLGEDLLGVERTVVFANSSMIASND